MKRGVLSRFTQRSTEMLLGDLPVQPGQVLHQCRCPIRKHTGHKCGTNSLVAHPLEGRRLESHRQGQEDHTQIKDRSRRGTDAPMLQGEAAQDEKNQQTQGFQPKDDGEGRAETPMANQHGD